MNNGAFVPMGKTYLVGTSSVQVKAEGNQTPTTYRIKAMLSTTQYLRWAPPDPTGTAITVGSVTAPSAGSPSDNTIGFFPGAVEVISLPANAWFKSDAVAAFEIIPGEGF